MNYLTNINFDSETSTGNYGSTDNDKSSEKNDLPENEQFVTGNRGGLKNYFSSLPIDVILIENPEINLATNKSKIVQHYLGVFLSSFERILVNTRILYKLSNNFPPIIIKWIADNSLLIEWNYNDFRIGFSIEPNIKESGWYLVSNENLGEYSESGVLDFNRIDTILSKLLIFAISNS